MVKIFVFGFIFFIYHHLEAESYLIDRALNDEKNCGKPHFTRVSPRIINGANATFGVWPWMVGLSELYYGQEIHVCGAVLINNEWIITAAHCLKHLFNPIAILGDLVLGTENKNNNLRKVRRGIKKYFIHPDRKYYRDKNNDLALLKLDSYVPYQQHILNVCLPKKSDNFANKMAFVTGWGYLDDERNKPKNLQEKRIRIFSDERL